VNLLIDDIRDLNVDVIARTGEAGINLLKTGLFSTVYLDYDLGHGVTGMAVLMDALKYMKEIIIVSGHPGGKAMMEEYLRKRDWTCFDSVWSKP